MMKSKTLADASALGGQFVGALDREQQRASIAQSNASIANIYDQINSRATARREAALTAAQEAGTAEAAAKETRTADTEAALEISKLANDMLNSPGLSAAVGAGFKKGLGAIPFVSGDAISGTNRADFEAVASRLSNLLTLDNLDLMSGVLSETDIKILQEAGSNLKNFDQSEGQYVPEIQRVLDVAQRTINNNGLTAEQAVYWGAITPEDAQNFDVIWDNL